MRTEKFTNEELENGYKKLKDFHEKYLANYGVKLPQFNIENPSKDLLVLLYLAENYPKTQIVSKKDLTKFIQLYDSSVNDVQQARHLGHQNGWYIISGTRGDNLAIENEIPGGSYKLISLEKCYPGYNAGRRIVTADFEELKKNYNYRCACCGSKEGKTNFRNPSKITKLQAGHMDPSKPLKPGNIIPQCDECNRADRDWWIFDKNGRVVGIGNESVIDRCSDDMQRKIYERLKLKFNDNTQIKEGSINIAAESPISYGKKLKS